MTHPGKRFEASPGRLALLIFAAAFVVRLLFWQATPDARWPGSALYEGDATLWLDYAAALVAGRPFELGLPLRPPGTGWLLALLTDGELGRLAIAQVAWCALGALVAPLTFLAAWRLWGPPAALIAGFLCAGSAGLMALATSLNSETPYLALVLATLVLYPAVRRRPTLGRVGSWSALHAVAALLRAEHLLFFGLLGGYLLWVWHRQDRVGLRRLTHRAAAAAFGLALVLGPWQLSASRAVGAFNASPMPLSVGEEALLAGFEQRLSHLRWEPLALAERERLPAFCRRPLGLLVAATVAHRGRETVTAGDFAILKEAFGAPPEPLPRWFPVALYGPLNFALANHADADGGFSRSALQVPPPLAGGRDRYPAALVAGLPPPVLSLTYPPHLSLIARGYAHGWSWIADHPGGALRLAGRKLARFGGGGTLGLTGWNLPAGWDGRRERVDLTLPEATPLAMAWRIAVLGVAAAGLAIAWRHRELHPWLLFAGAQVAVAIAFFGYARLGAMVIPVLALLAGGACQRLCPPVGRLAAGSPRRLWSVALAGSLLLVGAEVARWASPPTIHWDGVAITERPPPAQELVAPRELELR